MPTWSVDAINFFVTKECQKTRKIDENNNIKRENLHMFQTTWGTLMIFSERCDLILKVTKNQSFILSLENTNLEKVTTTVKIWSKRLWKQYIT